ncbi:hypothetical protein [Thalassotalea sp. PLHSN55]|uniref:hypothetical protein n=1 Tax=Thalassotalea sp. PLHSN55 TaxID=3435888 RepID=UPI003F85837B
MKHLYIAILTVLLVAACKTTHPIYNATATVPVNVSTEVMEKSIKTALVYKRWKLVSQQDNEITAGIHVRSHYAEVKISYNANTYNIDYVRSINLDYDSEKQGIHRNYNKWIMLLEQEIERNLLMAK